MLKPAFLFQNELNEAYQSIIYNDKYRFLVEDVWDYSIKIDESDKYRIQLVSANAENNIIGYFCADTDRKNNNITNLEVINFREANPVYTIDFHRFIKSLTEKYGFRKVTFEVIVGSPYQDLYDKYLKRYNGREIGIRYQDVKLADGNYYDVKIYELYNTSVLRL